MPVDQFLAGVLMCLESDHSCFPLMKCLLSAQWSIPSITGRSEVLLAIAASKEGLPGKSLGFLYFC